LPKVLAKLSAILSLLPELFPCRPKKLVEIAIFAEIMTIVAKFQKNSIIRAENFAKLSLKY